MNRKGKTALRKDRTKDVSVTVLVSLQESSGRGIKSQKKWSIALGPQNFSWAKNTVTMAHSSIPTSQDAVTV